jgi:large repetitive protein
MWVTSNVTPESAPNDAFVPDQNGISDKVLDRVGVMVTSASAVMSFRNNFNTEFSDGTYWDGYVLEVSTPSISGGDFLDITDPHVGGSFVSGGYTGEIDGTAENPLAGRLAWSSSSNGYIDTVINLGPNLAGQTATFRFRMGSDEAVAAPGVRIDNISIMGASCP